MLRKIIKYFFSPKELKEIKEEIKNLKDDLILLEERIKQMRRISPRRFN
jgi:ubiquinone biosynthesis protein UbiJ